MAEQVKFTESPDYSNTGDDVMDTITGATVQLTDNVARTGVFIASHSLETCANTQV